MSVTKLVSLLQEIGAIVAAVIAYAHTHAVASATGLSTTGVVGLVSAGLAVALQQNPVLLRYVDGIFNQLTSSSGTSTTSGP